jgi:hypothetical protein
MVAALGGVVLLVPSVFPAEAEGQFGRNRIRYESHDLRLVRTSRIDLYHSPDLEPVAEEAALLADRVYRRLSRVLQHEFRDQIPILLYGSRHQFQQTNALPTPLDEGTGGVTEFFKRRVVLPFTGSWPEFEHVLAHELVHAFQLDILYGAAPPEVLIHGPRPPLWFMEGMAEFLSLGGVDPRTEAWVRDGVLTGYLPDLQTLGESGGWLSYRYGQSFWAFVASRWGEESVGDILQRTPRLGMDGAFLAVTGREPFELGHEWVREVRRRILPGLVGEGGSGTGVGVHSLTPREGPGDPWTVAPTVSPDGSRIAYLSTRGGESFDLWLADGDGRPLRRLARGGRSPGLESLRFMSSGPAFSPDGKTLAFTARAGGGDVLVLVDERGRTLRRIDLPLRGVETPRWSPDGRRIVVSGTADGRSDLWSVNRDGTGLQRLTDDRWAALLPAWSPDGGSIAFVTDGGAVADDGAPRSGPWRIALLEVATGRVALVPGQEGGGNTSPAWSPDGRWLAWVGESGGVPALQLHRLGSGRVDRVVGAPWPLMGITPLSPVLSWSAAGPLVAVRFERGGYALHRVEDPLALDRTPLPSGARVSDGEVGRGDGGEPSLREESLRRALREGRSLATLRAILDSEAVEPTEGGVERLPVPIRLTPDLVARPTLGAQFGGAFGSGLFGGGAVALSDILGNHRVTMGATLNGSLRDAAAQGHWVWSRHRWDLIVGAEQAPFYRWVSSSVIPGERRDGREDVFLRELDRRVTLGGRYPFSTFRRLELALAAGAEGRDLVSVGFDPDGRGFRRSRRVGSEGYLQHSAAWVHDDTRWGMGGPVGGRRARIELLRSTGGIRFDQLRADVRGYVGRVEGPVVAGRLTALVREGEDADLRTFYWGGPGGIRGWGGGSFGGSGSRECSESREEVPGGALSPCPVRDQLVGSSGALASLELRWPVVREIRFGTLGLPPVDLLLFSDAGMAWSTRVCTDGSLGMSGDACDTGVPVGVGGRRSAGVDPFRFRTPVGSWGLGLRLNLLVVQAEIHHARPFPRPGRGGVWGVVLGPAF